MKKWNKERFATIWENLESMIKLRSLRARIFLLILVIGLVPCIVMRHGIVSNYEDMAVEQRITVVQNQLMILANHLVSNNYLSSHGVREDTGNSREVINAELEMLSNLYEGRVMIINKNFKVEKDTYGISEGKTIISEEVIKCFQGENVSHYDPEHGYIEMTTPIMDTTANTTDENGKKNPDAIRGVMLTSISNDSIVNAKEVLNRKAYIMEVIMIVAILALAILLFSKREDQRAVSKLSIAPGLFNINEPMIFGIPIVMNPIYCIPFILAPAVSITFGYVMTAIGFAKPMAYAVPATTPIILKSFLATAGDIPTMITEIMALFLVFLLYVPFVLISNKQAAEEKKQQEETA